MLSNGPTWAAKLQAPRKDNDSVLSLFSPKAEVNTEAFFQTFPPVEIASAGQREHILILQDGSASLAKPDWAMCKWYTAGLKSYANYKESCKEQHMGSKRKRRFPQNLELRAGALMLFVTSNIERLSATCPADQGSVASEQELPRPLTYGEMAMNFQTRFLDHVVNSTQDYDDCRTIGKPRDLLKSLFEQAVPGCGEEIMARMLENYYNGSYALGPAAEIEK